MAMTVLAAFVHIARAAAYTGGGMLALGIAMAFRSGHAADVIAPFVDLADVIEAVMGFASATWRPALDASPFLTAGFCSWAGHTKGEIPGRFTPAGQAPDSVAITPSIVVTALRDLGIAPLRKAITDMADAGAAMLSPIRIAGCGVEVDVTLPSGTSTAARASVTAADHHQRVAKRNARCARPVRGGVNRARILGGISGSAVTISRTAFHLPTHTSTKHTTPAIDTSEHQ
jgi:hypothetical protein